MSEPPPEQTPEGQNFFTRKFAGIPGWVFLVGGGLVAYFLFFRNSSSSSGTGASSSGGGGTSTTGDIQLQPGTETIDLSGTSSPTTTANPAPVNTQSGGTAPEEDNDPGQPAQHGTPNPQPTPKPPPKKKTTVTKVTHKAAPGTTVTVAKWPGKSVNGNAQWNTTLWGIAQHYHTSVADLLKLNPTIRNANLIYPGQKIKVP